MNSSTLHTQLARIDWSQPWWNPWRAVGGRVAQQVLAGAQVGEALNAEQQALCQPRSSHGLASVPPAGLHWPAPPANRATSARPQFVAQAALPEGVAYEAFIFETGQVPTRENLHDFFNGLAWLVFPHTKRRLNAMQYGELARGGVQATRGALRDALTLFDENAALWPCAGGPPHHLPCEPTAQLVEALRSRQWQHAFTTLRAHWQGHAPVLFGHALLEKLVTPYKSITAHVYMAPTAINNIAIENLDTAVAAQLSPAELAPKPFIPLPVLGVPGWWLANEDPTFYDDTQVFRAPRAPT